LESSLGKRFPTLQQQRCHAHTDPWHAERTTGVGESPDRDGRHADMDERTAVTLEDVARAAGVSLATASRALNGSSRRVRPEYVDRVRAAAELLHYSANVQAQSVARGTTTTVALVVGDIADPYFAEIAAGAIRAASAAGLVLTITATGGDPEHEARTLLGVTGLRPRAVVLAATRHTSVPADSSIAALRGSGAAVVALVSDDLTDVDLGGATPLTIGNRAGAAALADALVDDGHRDFALLTADPGLVTARARTTGFLAGLDGRGVVVAADRAVPGAFNRDGGFRSMTELLDRGVRPGCVFAVNDVMAMGALARLRAAGLSVPGDVALAGFDDITTLRDVMAMGALAAIRAHGLEPGRDIGVAGFDDVRTLADVVPGLSTVRLPLAEIGALAVATALGADAPAAVAGEVVLRASTRRT
jgi:LacI family transcriptional regulator